MNIEQLYEQFAAQNGTVEFAGRAFSLINQAELTATYCIEGQEYVSEYSAAAMGYDGHEYVVIWRFDVIKGQEPDSSYLNWNSVYNVIAA